MSDKNRGDEVMNDAEVCRELRIATMTLRDISSRTDCAYIDCPDEKPKPCPCAKCSADDALDEMDKRHAKNWRYRGAVSHRTETNPREHALIDAWANDVDDRRLAAILSPRGEDRYRGYEMPTVRDWYVATSVVQWLATNVGMEVLRRAGFLYDFEKKEREKKS